MRTTTAPGQNFLMITEEDLRRIIKSECQQAVSAAFDKAKQEEHPEYYSPKEVMSRLKIKETKLYRLKKYGFLHPVEVGARKMYLSSEVDGLIGRKIHLPQ